MSENTKYGDRIPDDAWTAEEAEHPEDEAIEIDHHIRIYDERDAIERYNGLVWRPIIDDGVVTAIDKSHYCPGRGHTDPMGFVGWSEVPGPVQKTILQALGVTSAEEVVDTDATEEVAEDQWPRGED